MHRHQARELHEAAVAAQDAADYLALARLAKELIALCERNGDTLGLAWGHYFAGAASYQRNNGGTAEREYRRARELFTEIDNPEGTARSMLGLAAVALDIDLDVAQARALYDQAVPVVRKLGDKRRLGIVLGNLGEICRLEGSSQRALRHAGEAVALFREIGDHASAGWQLANVGHYNLLRRDEAAAIESMRAAYEETQQDPIPRWVAWYFDIWFIIAAALNQWEVAASLLAFVNKYRDENNCPRLQGILPWFSGPVEELSRRLPDDRLHELFIEGEALTVETAQAMVEAIPGRRRARRF